MSKDLDKAFEAVEPWIKFNKHFERDPSATRKQEKGKEDTDEEKVIDTDELYELPSMPNSGQIHFESEQSGRIYR